MKKPIFVALLLLLSGCVANPGIVPDGPDAYRIMAVGSTGFTSSGSMQMKIYQQATDYCATKGLVAETLATDSQQAHPFGGYPEATLRFRCVVRDQNAK
jgi:hypothetical protein